MTVVHTLLIEDNPADARLVEEMLAGLDDIQFDITMRESLADGAAFLDDHEADVVLLDLGLPDSQGMETFKSMHQKAPLVPIVVLTGLKDEELAVEMAREGAQEYLVKDTISSEVLTHTIQYAIERKNVEKHMHRLNSLLQAIREINQLIVRESDPEELITQTCNALASVSDYHHVRIFLTDELGEAQLGICADQDGTTKYPESGIPVCMERAIADSDIVAVETMGSMCSECPWNGSYDEEYNAVAIPLSYLGNVYGALSVLIPTERQEIAEEEGLFKEVADDLAFALYDLELEEKHRETEERYQQLVESTPGLICQLDPDGTTRFVNSYVEELMGYTVEEVVGEDWWSLFYPGDTREQVDELYDRFKADDDVRGFEMEMTDKHGERHIISWNSFNQWENGALQKIFGVGVDVTERETFLEKLKEKHRETEAMLESMLNAFVLFESVFDEDGNFVSYRFVYINKAYEEMTGVKLEDVKGKTVHEVWPDTEPEWIKRYGEVAVTGESQTFDLYHDPTGKVYHCNVYRPYDTQEKFCVIFEDITDWKQAQQELKAREKKFREIFHNANDAMYLHTLTDDGMPDRFIEVNDVACEMLGYTREEFLEMSPMDIDDPDAPTDVPAVMQDLLDEGHATFEMRHVAKDGSRVPVEISSHAFTLNGEQLVLSIARDITERKKRQRRLESSQEIAHVGSWEIDLATGDLSWSDETCRIFGVPVDEPVDYDTFLDFVHPEDRDHVDEKWNEALQTGEYDIEHRILVDGTTKWVREKADITFDGQGEPVEAIGSVQDITERKEREKTERELRQRIEAGLQAGNLAWWEMELPSGDVVFDDRKAEMLGYEPEHFETYEDFTELLHPDDYERAMQAMRDHLQGREENYEVEYRIRTSDGTYRWFRDVGGITERGEETGHTRVIGIVEDITERKQAQQELEKQERKLRMLFMETQNPILVANDEDVHVDANQAALDFLECDMETLRGTTPWDWVPPGRLEKQKEEHTPFEEPRTLETPYYVNGRVKTLLLNVVPLTIDGETLIYGIGQDITERKQYERRLRETKNRYQSLFDNSLVGSMLTTPDGDIVEANNALTTILGYDKSELGEMDAADLYRDASDREKIRELMEKNGILMGYETTLQHQDGSDVTVLLSISKVDIEGKPFYQKTCLDITRRKQVQRELQESEEKYRAIVEGSHDAIFIYRGDEFLFVNDRAAELTGYSEDELMDLPIWDLIHPDDLDMVKDVHRKWVQDEDAPNVYQARIVTKDGDVRHCEFSMTAISYHGREAAMGAVRDITRQKQAEKERERYINELQFTADTIISVSRMQDVDEICQMVARQVHEVNDDAVVAVSLYDPEREAITIRAVEGIGDRTQRLFDLFGFDPTEQSIGREKMKEASGLYATGTLEQVPGGLHQLMGGTLPKAACNAAEKLFGIDATYTVGFALGSDMPYGGISIFVPEGQELQYPSAIETVASHVSTALQRRQAEEERQKALEEMERALELEKHFKADAAHFFLNPIAIAKGYMELGIEEMPEESEEKIHRARKAIKRVETVIKNIVEKGEIHE